MPQLKKGVRANQAVRLFHKDPSPKLRRDRLQLISDTNHEPQTAQN
jgi:hypothetical protein